MEEQEIPSNSHELQKQKIRQRYKGIDSDLLEVIPARPIINFYDDKQRKRVAVYVRVSTDDPRQTSSYELQKNHYSDVISKHDGWQLIEIYADEGISGTSLQHRDSFIHMIEDCRAGKIDLILTKSVSRFSRNVLDCIGYVRELAAMNPPIEVYFETEGIHTLSKDSEMQLAFLATLAQEESHNKSEIMNASYSMRFSRGIFLTPELLGYNHDENGKLVINPEEALTVRFIFYMCLLGCSCSEIARELTKLGRKTKKGNKVWNPSSVRQILQNERHCGDVLAQKTWTPNYLDHKSKKNDRDRNQYLCHDHHASIVSRHDFIAAQKMLRNIRYGHKGFLPEMKVITEGALKGYISINPTWAGFKACDYLEAVDRMILDEEPDVSKVTAASGEFDLRGYEIAHGQFFSSSNHINLTFSDKTISATVSAIQKLDSVQVELLVNPKKMVFAVRSAVKDAKNGVTWAKKHSERYIAKPIHGRAFLSTLFELFHWNKERKYRIQGVRHQNESENVLIFDINDAVMLLPAKQRKEISDEDPLLFDENTEPIGTKNSVFGYPVEWAERFGTPFYNQQYSHESVSFDRSKNWDIQNSGQSYITELTQKMTPPDELNRCIKSLVGTMTKETLGEYNSG